MDNIMKNYSPTHPKARKMCDDSFNEANTMRQCVNNVYDKYGKTQSAIARRKLNMSNEDPVTTAIQKHNESCAQFPSTVIK